MEESISRMAGSYHGVMLTADELIAAGQAAGRPVAQRDTLYGVLTHY
jgi:FO synthase